MNRLIGAVGVVFGLAMVAPAQQIDNRVDLNALLAGGVYYEEAFEAFNIASGSAVITDSSNLSSTSVVSGQGPGLVEPGAIYETDNVNDLLQWDGANYYGSTSEEILAAGNEMAVNYTMNVNAMGMDLRAFLGFGDTYTADVYNGSTLVGTYAGTLANDGSSTFFGWQNAAGITSVDFFGSGNLGWSPIIDNHTYGLMTAPEPASLSFLALGGLALLRRRRSAKK